MCIVVFVKEDKHQSSLVRFCIAHTDVHILYDTLMISDYEIQKNQKEKNLLVPLSKYLRTNHNLKEVNDTKFRDSNGLFNEETSLDDNANAYDKVSCPLLQQAQKSYLRSSDSQSTNLLRSPLNDMLVTLLTSSIIFLALAIVIRLFVFWIEVQV